MHPQTHLCMCVFAVMSDSLRLCVCVCVCVYTRHDCSLPGSSVHGNFLGKNTEVGHFLLQGIFLSQRWNLRLLYYYGIWVLYHGAAREALSAVKR